MLWECQLLRNTTKGWQTSWATSHSQFEHGYKLLSLTSRASKKGSPNMRREQRSWSHVHRAWLRCLCLGGLTQPTPRVPLPSLGHILPPLAQLPKSCVSASLHQQRHLYLKTKEIFLPPPSWKASINSSVASGIG